MSTINILVTGAQGMLGKSLQEEITKTQIQGFQFLYLSRSDCDLKCSSSVKNLFENLRPDIVIHLASSVGGLYENLSHNFEFYTDNLLINTNIVKACSMFGVKRLINILSTCVFPDKVPLPLRSQYLHEGPPHYSNEGYANSKRSLHLASKYMNQTIGTDVVNLIPTNLYGKWDHFDETKSHVIPALIGKFAKKEFTLLGTGYAKRQFVYSNDLAKIILSFTTLDKKLGFRDVIVCPPLETEITILALAEKIKTIMGFTYHPLITNPNFPDGQAQKTSDDLDVKNYFPDFQFTTLDKGLKEVIEHVFKDSMIM